MAVGGHFPTMKAALAGALLWALTLAVMLLTLPGQDAANAASTAGPTQLGVASCAGSTCHGRLEGDGRVVAQNELKLWQEPSSQGGAHARAFAVLTTSRARQITATLGMGDPTSAKECLGCHASPAASRGPTFQISDGVGCEACHGGAAGWISSHYAVGATHASNVANGMIALDNPQIRAGVCLDCHFGSERTGQFVSHRFMAAGHPRISFELDLFSTIQQHWVEDADYVHRKRRSSGVTLWAVGQAMAVQREMSLFASAKGTEGAFPEFYYFDCHSCHRRIADGPERTKTFEANPGRPIPTGMPPFNDENMIMLSAAAKLAAPALAGRFDADTRAFHQALAKDRPSAVAAANRMAQGAAALSTSFSRSGLGDDMAFALVDAVTDDATLARFTDYEGSVQAVMAIDTLLNALVRSGRVSIGAAAGIRGDINRAYDAVKEPNAYRPGEFRTALASAARSVRALR